MIRLMESLQKLNKDDVKVIVNPVASERSFEIVGSDNQIICVYKFLSFSLKEQMSLINVIRDLGYQVEIVQFQPYYSVCVK